MENLNFCRRLGYLVSASYPIFQDLGEFCVPGAVWIVGCSRLVCARCKKLVRNQEGIFGHDGDRPAKTYATEDWTTLKYLSHGPNWAGHRFYSCQCESHTEGSMRPLDNSEDEGPLPSWKCSGHPRAVPGGRYYGVVVDPELNWTGLVDKAFRGWKPEEVWPETSLPWQAIWLRGLYRRLLGTPMAGQLSTAIAGFLTHPEPMMRAIALRFFYGQPASPGGERLAELVEGDRRLFSGVKNPYPTDEPDLEAWLLGALGQRLALGTIDGDGQRNAADRDELVRIARSVALTPGIATPVIKGLAQADGQWLIEHAPEVTKATPAAAAEILERLDATVDDVHLVAARIGGVEGVDMPALRRAVKEVFMDEDRRKILAALSRTVRRRNNPGKK